MENVHKFHLALTLQDDKDQEASFLLFVQTFLETNGTLTEGSRRVSIAGAETNPLVIKFLQSYGEKLWPSVAKYCHHLFKRKPFTKGRNLFFNTHSKLRGSGRKTWDFNSPGKEPNAEDELVRSELGMKLAAYFRAAAKAGMDEDELADTDMDELLVKITSVGSDRAVVAEDETAVSDVEAHEDLEGSDDIEDNADSDDGDSE